MLRKLTLVMATVVMILARTSASEAGGLFFTEFGTEDVALAGAGWAARAQDASTLFKNPAGMSRLEGNQFQGGLQALYFQGGGISTEPESRQLLARSGAGDTPRARKQMTTR